MYMNCFTQSSQPLEWSGFDSQFANQKEEMKTQTWGRNEGPFELIVGLTP